MFLVFTYISFSRAEKAVCGLSAQARFLSIIMHVDEILIANAQRYKQIRVNEVVGSKPQTKLLKMLKFAYKN